MLGHSLVVDPLVAGGNKIVSFVFMNPADGGGCSASRGR